MFMCFIDSLEKLRDSLDDSLYTHCFFNFHCCSILFNTNFGYLMISYLGCQIRRNSSHSFPNFILNTLRFQRSGEWNFYSQKGSWFEQKLRIYLSKIFVFWFWCFRGQFQKKLQLYLEQRLLELAIPEFFELLYARKLLKKLQKLNLKVETLMFPSFSHNLGHSEETFFHKSASLKPVMRT